MGETTTLVPATGPTPWSMARDVAPDTVQARVDEPPETMLTGVAPKLEITGTGVDVPPLLQAARVRAATPAIRNRRDGGLAKGCMRRSSGMLLVGTAHSPGSRKMVAWRLRASQGIHGK